MKIIRKKGVDKIRITHNKKLLWIILILIGLLIVVIYFGAKNNKKIDEGLSCKTNEDCVEVQTGCCPCSSGGEETCVLKSEVKSYQDKLANCSKRTICTQMFNCKIKSCECINNTCSEIK